MSADDVAGAPAGTPAEGSENDAAPAGAGDNATAKTPGAGAPAPQRGLSRRGMLGLIGAGAGGLVVGGLGGVALARPPSSPDAQAADDTTYPFFGEHQAGIATRVQEHLHFAAFDMAPGASRDDLVSLLKDWSYAASRITQGLDVSASGAVGGSLQAPPDDTGEALGLAPAGLTITFGLGPDLFGDQFGLASQRPSQLAKLPPFVGEQLSAELSGGALAIQACADDPQVAFHAVRNLSRIAFGRAQIRWSQLGFGRTSRTTADQATPRNLFGFRDGTNNVLGTDDAAMNEHVWVQPGADQPWLTGGSYLAVRNIRQRMETWDRLRLVEQQDIFGRAKGSGGPLTGGDEFAPLKFGEVDASGKPVIDPKSHVARAHPDANGGIRILRRGYNFVNGNDVVGALSAGLFFISFQRSPDRFITVQQAVATDLLAEYLVHVGSGLFAVPPGAQPGSFVGETLFA